ncbi:MAG: LTA synthase family protein [Chitinophagales bacterium]|nr:LTA synthase family protein [Chitinophagales bacterium]
MIFFINRGTFIIFFHQKFADVPLIEVMLSFWNGLRLDFSASSYLIVIPLLILITQQLFRFSFAGKLLTIYSTIILAWLAFLCLFDIGIYRDWATKANARAFAYLKQMSDAIEFTDWTFIILSGLIFLALMVAGWKLYKYFFQNERFTSAENLTKKITAISVYLLLLPVLFLGVRGGWQLIPINESSSYFSRHQILNDAAVNTFWYTSKNFLQYGKSSEENRYHYFSSLDVEQKINSLYNTQNDSTISVLTNNRPNIVWIILESFTADVIQSLGGDTGVTPNMDTIIQHGLLFNNIYSQGFRTDQGLVSYLSAFPTQPDFTIITQTEKLQHLSFIPKILDSIGYHTSFYYGGESGFANMKTYLIDAGIEKIVDKSSFTLSQMSAKWGAHDQYVFEKQAAEMNIEQQPFFSIVLSLSSHEPFFIPIPSKFPGKSEPALFKSACYYTDQCLGNYFRSIKNTEWYKNTLFILVADHGHRLPRNRELDEPGRFHIPFILFGDVLKPEYQGKQLRMLGMQLDIAATLLSQLQIASSNFEWSNNLLNPYRNDFAYYCYDSGFGWMRDKDAITMRFDNKSITYHPVGNNNSISVSEFNNGKAFLQKLMEEFSNY